jgi:predicted dehydrogenase
MKRRDFLKVSGIGTTAFVSSVYLPSVFQERKIKIGLIGAGWYGMVISRAALKAGGVEIAAICDVDSDHLNSSADELEKLQGTRPKTFKYYTELLDQKNLEVIFIGTMPHWHALQFIAACKKGFDIYCEKPLAYDVMEGLAMVDAAKKAGNIVQVGFQRRQSNAFKKTKELINSGRIGTLHQVVAQINYNPVLKETTVQAPPSTLDWEEWCGPAPKLDYRPSIGHMAWRLEKEYGNGHLVDWGIHHIDIIRHIMDEEMPEEFFATGGIYVLKDQITTPDTLTATMNFRKAPVVWQHRLWGNGDASAEFSNGIYFHGDKGTLFAQDSKVVIFPAGKDSKREDMDIPTPQMQEDHVANFLQAVRNKDKGMISCDPEDAFKSTATVQLAMIAYYSGSIVKWDQKKHEIIDNSEASAQLKRKYRKYEHPSGNLLNG